MFNCHKLLTRSREVPLRICRYSSMLLPCTLQIWQGKRISSLTGHLQMNLGLLTQQQLLIPIWCTFIVASMQAPTLNPQVATKSINLKLWVDLTKCSFPMHTQTHNTFSQPILPQDLMRLSNTLSVRVAPRSSPVDQTNPILVSIP